MAKGSGGGAGGSGGRGTPRERLMAYAKKHNDGKTYTNEQWLGKMVKEGVVLNRSSNSTTYAEGKRDGKVIRVIETTVTKTPKVVNGRLDIVEERTSKTVMRMTL
jgi:hypothetical protein